MKKICKLALYLVLGISMYTRPAFAEDLSNTELMREIKAMEARIEKLETSLKQKEAEMKALKNETAKIKKDKDKAEETASAGKWSDRINISGLIEVEAAHESMDFRDPAVTDGDMSDVTLATVELGIDAEISKYVSGHVLLLWEEDETEPVDIDEGFISIHGDDAVPFYLDAGKMYVPFGSFESHFISDPITLEIGETRESAVKAGFANDMFDISLSFFNGDIDETTGDDEIETFVGSAVFTLPEGAFPELGLTLGVSYISNIADSDGLEGEVLAGAVNDHVGGIGLFLSATLMESLFFDLEYVGATDKFVAGELSFDSGLAYEPKAFNLELAWTPREDLELAIKYEGSDDLGEFMPEKQFGGVISYALFEKTSIGFEYLHGEFENNDERDLFTAQLAIEF